MDETLCVISPWLFERLRRSLGATNAVEGVLSRTRHVERSAKQSRWASLALRWVAGGILEAAKGF